MDFRIEYSPEAEAHLGLLRRREAKHVLDSVDRALRYEPTRPTRNRKRLRANSIAPWELRVATFRVYFDVTLDPTPLVTVRAVGVKIRERVWIGGVVVDLG